MSEKPSSLGWVGVAVLLLVFLFVGALTVPMRHGATFWEAIAVLPQAVLWVVPTVFATPVLLALAFRVRPHWHRLRDPEPPALPSGSLAPIVDALRAVEGSRLARSRVHARLARLAADVAVCQYGGTEESAWETSKRRLRERNPKVAKFLAREGTLHLSGDEFVHLVEETLAELERQQQEA